MAKKNIIKKSVIKLKKRLNNIKFGFTKPRKMNYAVALLVMAAYGAAVFYGGMQFQGNAKADSISIVKIPVAQASSPK